MATTASLLVEMGMNLARLEADMRTATSKIQSFASGVTRTFAMIGAGISIAGITMLVKESAGAIQAFDRLGQTVGMSANEIMKWDYVAKMADSDLETLLKSMRILDKNMFAAAQGTGKAYEALRTLNIDTKNSAGALKTNDEIMKELADKFSKMPNGVMKTAIAMQVFGKSGADMIPVLNLGREGIEAFMKEAEELRGVLSDELIAKAEGVEQAFKKFAFYRQAGRFQFFDGMSDALLRVANAFQTVVKRGEGMRILGELVGGALKVIASAALLAMMGIYELSAALEVAKIGWNNFVDFITSKWNAIATWVNEFSGNNVFPLFDAEKIKFANAKSMDDIWADLKVRIATNSKALKGLWAGPSPEMPKAIKPPGVEPIMGPSKQQIDAWAKVKADFEKMIGNLAAEQAKLLPGIDEWDKKIADLSKRYSEYIAKLDEAKTTIPEHAAEIDKMKDRITEYREVITTLIRNERDAEEAFAGITAAMKSYQNVSDDLNHTLDLQRTYMTTKEIYDQQIRNIDELIESYKLLASQIVITTQKDIDRLQSINDIIVALEKQKETATANAKVQLDANAGMLKALTDLQNEYSNQGELMEDFTQKTFRNMESYLVDFTETGKFEFKEFVQAVLKDLTRLFIQLTILEPLARNLKNALSQTESSGGGGGGFGGLLSGVGGSAGNWFSGLLNSAVSKFDIWSLGGNAAVLGMLHKGGIVGETPLSIRSIEKYHTGGIVNQITNIIQRMHSGGLVSQASSKEALKMPEKALRANEILTILEKGEGVIPSKQVNNLRATLPSMINKVEKIFGKSDKNTTTIKSLSEILKIQKYHTGGIVSSNLVQSISKPISDMQRMHEGGKVQRYTEKIFKELKTNEIPVILERGEAVLPKSKVKELQVILPAIITKIEKTFGRTDRNTTILKSLHSTIGGMPRYHEGGVIGFATVPKYHDGGTLNDFSIKEKVVTIPVKEKIINAEKTPQQNIEQTENINQSNSKQQLTVIIQAVDALSFMDLCNRNPGAILGPLEKALKGNTSIRYTIRETLR